MTDHSFWHNKWEKNEIGFHLQNFHPLLEKYSEQIFSGHTDIFVPLCGKTADLRYLSRLDKKVVGVELSEIAAKAFYQEQFEILNPVSKTTDKKMFQRYSEQNVQILVGDYFSLNSSLLNNATGIYDRAALVALPEDMRKLYVEQIKNICPTASMLLIALDYEQSKMSGPPFSVVPQEINQLFSFAKIKQLSRKNIIDKEPKFISKGLTSFYQTAYHISW